MFRVNTAASFGLVSVLLAGVAQATPVTFAQVTDTNSANGLTWTNNGDGTATLNTDVAAGDSVNFSFENVTGLPNFLSGQLSAIELINNGAGITTSAQASQANFGGATYDTQALNAPLTVSYLIALGGHTYNLFSVMIVPNAPGANGLVLTGVDGGSGGGASASNKSRPPPSYTEWFTSDFLHFPMSATITAGFSFSALIPEFAIAADGLLDSFSADVVGTFSSDPPPAYIAEPATLAVLGAGLAGLTLLRRRRSVL